MVTDKVALGRQGELFVLSKLQQRGWNIDYGNCRGIDLIVSNNKIKISIRVKTSLKKRLTFSVSGKRNFDYLIITDLKNCWIIHKYLFENTDKLNSTYKKLKNQWHLLNLSSVALLSAINDCGVRLSEINRPSLFLRLKVPAFSL